MTTMMAMGSPAAAALPNPVFEGSEKRIEIDFYLPAAGAAAAAGAPPPPLPGQPPSPRGLRALPRALLDELMSLAACTIVSRRSNACLDAYVLSESSLFVYEAKWVLKTCGTTRLLAAVPRLLEAARRELGMLPRRCCFTRASFLFPEQQPAPHTSFESEARFLRGCVAPLLGAPGAAYVLGDMLSGLQWHVYVADADGAAYMAPHYPPVGNGRESEEVEAEQRGLGGGGAGAAAGDDEGALSFGGLSLGAGAPRAAPHRRPTHKLEVCMTGLCPEAAKRFFRSPVNPLWPLGGGAADVTRATGLGALVPGALLDDYVFEPCGYSMNGIDGPGLLTVHITPEPGFSYASVELAGFPAESYDPAAMAASVAAIFRPEHMSVSLSVDAAPPSGEYGWGALAQPPPGYACGSATCQELAAGGRVAYYTFAPLSPAAASASVGAAHAAAAAAHAAPAGTQLPAAAPPLVGAPSAGPDGLVAAAAEAQQDEPARRAAPCNGGDALPAPLERAPEPVRKAALAAMATRRPHSPATVLLRHMPSFSSLPSDAELFGSGCVTSAPTTAGSSGGGSSSGNGSRGGSGRRRGGQSGGGHSGSGGEGAAPPVPPSAKKLPRSKSLVGRALMASANKLWAAPAPVATGPGPSVPKVPTRAPLSPGLSASAAAAAISPPSSPSSQ